MSHTPGPWAYDADSHEIFSTDEAHSAGRLASVRGNDSNGRFLAESERLANARLIAAAPDLLDAVEELLIYLADWDDPDNETCQRARAAVAKAKGESR